MAILALVLEPRLRRLLLLGVIIDGSRGRFGVHFTIILVLDLDLDLAFFHRVQPSLDFSWLKLTAFATF